MAEAIQPKWFEVFADLLQCRVCLAYPEEGQIYQCIEGHVICRDCRREINVCLYCKKQWSESENHLAESLRQKLYDVKWMLMIDSEKAKNKANKAVGAPNVPGQAPGLSQGLLYPCCIGYCLSVLPNEALLDHISAKHWDALIPDQLGDKKVWSFHNTERINSDHAFRVPGCGTFFSKISLDEYGNLIGCVLMIGTAAASEEFKYKLQIEPADAGIEETWTMTGQVQSCRTTRELLAKKSPVVLPSTMRPSIGVELHCTVYVRRGRAEEYFSSKLTRALRTHRSASRPATGETVPAKRSKNANIMIPKN